MYELPYSYAEMNALEGRTPQAFLKIHNTGVSRFFKKYLMQDAISIFKWKLPEHWDADFFRYVLMGWGFLAIFKTDIFGVIPMNCTLSGYNVFYKPTRALIANPLIESRDLILHKEAVLLKLSPDYGSVADLVDYYGDLLALTYESLSVNILNSRLAYLIGVSGKAEADTFKLLFDNLLSGMPAVVYRKAPPAGSNLMSKSVGEPAKWETLVQNLKQSFVAADMIDVLNSIRDEFLTAIGIPNLSERKKERINTIDSQRNTFETQTKIDLWLEELNAGIEEAKAMFPELENNFSVERRYNMEVANNDTNAVNSRLAQLR